MMIRDDKNGFFKMMKGRAVYLALAVCVLAAGVVSYTAVKKPSPTAEEPTAGLRDEPSTYIHLNERILPEDPAAAETPAEQTDAPEAEAVFENPVDPLETTAAAPKEIVFSLPCGGRVGMDYSMGVPVFSETMGDYRTHNGVDFLADAGQPVCAVAEGRVTKVETDVLYGNTVTVDHGGGVVSRVSGLADEGLIREGADVYPDTVLGVVGVLPAEQAEGSHIHLEIRVDGALRDPLEVMGFVPDGD